MEITMENILSVFKKVFYIMLVITNLLLCGCSQTYYQILTVKSTENSLSDKMVYEDDIVRVKYDFWGNKGKMAFSIYNKTDSIIYVDMLKSHFVKNDMAFDYFTNATLGRSVSYAKYEDYSYAVKFDNISPIIYLEGQLRNVDEAVISSANSVSESKSITYTEMSVIAIPPKTFKTFNKYRLFDYYIPEGEDKDILYSSIDTPLNFRNYLVIKQNNENYIINNSFYIYKVSIPKISEDVKLHESSVRREKNHSNKTNDIEKLYSKDKFYVVYMK